MWVHRQRTSTYGRIVVGVLTDVFVSRGDSASLDQRRPAIYTSSEYSVNFTRKEYLQCADAAGIRSADKKKIVEYFIVVEEEVARSNIPVLI